MEVTLLSASHPMPHHLSSHGRSPTQLLFRTRSVTQKRQLVEVQPGHAQGQDSWHPKVLLHARRMAAAGSREQERVTQGASATRQAERVVPVLSKTHPR